MTQLEKEIEELKNKHVQLELDSYNIKLKEKYEQLKSLEGIVEVRIYKSSKVNRNVNIIYHVAYSMLKDTWKKETDPEHNYIGMKVRTIDINEFPRAPYKRFSISTNEITPDSYNGKIHVLEETKGYDYSTYKRISVDDFEAIWNLSKIATKQVLDGILDITDVKWLMTGSSEDKEYKEEELIDKEKNLILDIPHILLSQEESWYLDNKYTRLFLNKNIYIITPNSLKALDKWYDYEVKDDQLCYELCSSVGERWRGSRVGKYYDLISKIKQHKTK